MDKPTFIFRDFARLEDFLPGRLGRKGSTVGAELRIEPSLTALVCMARTRLVRSSFFFGPVMEQVEFGFFAPIRSGAGSNMRLTMMLGWATREPTPETLFGHEPDFCIDQAFRISTHSFEDARKAFDSGLAAGGVQRAVMHEARQRWNLDEISSPHWALSVTEREELETLGSEASHLIGPRPSSPTRTSLRRI